MTDKMIAMNSGRDCAQRIGAARLVRAAYAGVDLTSLRDDLRTLSGNPGPAMDLAVVEQLMGDRDRGLQIQNEALARQQCYRTSGSPAQPRLRVLAIAAPVDVGGNTPVEFLIADPTIELTFYYVLPGQPIEGEIPEHDIAVVTIPDQGEALASFDQLRPLIARWPRPIVNAPRNRGLMDRDELYVVLRAIPNLYIPASMRLPRAELQAIGVGGHVPANVQFPLIVRPLDSHAGQGLERLAGPADVLAYLATQPADAFFLSSFIDYSSPDGLFRKYRIVFVDGRAYACHMAIAESWAVWYLNADMYASADKREEEARFMARFDDEFGLRHKAALAELVGRLGLDYVSIDCAETKDGELFVFEASVAMLVHDMDPEALYPYKLPQMRKIFAAFTAMLDRRATTARLAA